MRIAKLLFLVAVAALLPSCSHAALFSGTLGAAPPVYPQFAQTSFWYKTIPADATLNTNSANLTATFVSQVGSGVGSNIYQYSATLFNPKPTDPIITVTPVDCFNLGFLWPPGIAAMWAAVPFPPDAGPSAGTDEEMTIYDAPNDTLYEFWQLQSTGPGAWQACRGGQMTGVSANPGYWSNSAGAAATGLPFAAGQITVAELQAGQINHVMGLAVGNAEVWSIYSWPAQRSDGYNPNNLPNQIPEGLRCRLDPTINVDALGLNPIATMIAKAAQTYGFVVWDKTGSTPSLRFENAASRTAQGLPDPYVALLNGIPDYQLLAGFPWSSLQWMPMNYGQPP